jgi:hypothetical protein
MTGIRPIRLACYDCDRNDFDGVTMDQFQQALRDGWINVRQVQLYEDSIKTYNDPADEPQGFIVLNWFTHIGTCPNCQ